MYAFFIDNQITRFIYGNFQDIFQFSIFNFRLSIRTAILISFSSIHANLMIMKTVHFLPSKLSSRFLNAHNELKWQIFFCFHDRIFFVVKKNLQKKLTFQKPIILMTRTHVHQNDAIKNVVQNLQTKFRDLISFLQWKLFKEFGSH